jgi:hypothetical protein
MMRITTLLLLSFLYFPNIQAQKVCRQNYKNEASVSYNELFSFVFGAVGMSYERTLYHKKGRDNFISIQLDFAFNPNRANINDRIIALNYLTPSLKYNFGDRHIYSIGTGVAFSSLNTTPIIAFNYKYDFRKYKFTIGAGLQISYFGLAKTIEYYHSTPPTVITSPFWQYSYDYSLQDRILFNIRVGKYF